MLIDLVNAGASSAGWCAGAGTAAYVAAAGCGVQRPIDVAAPDAGIAATFSRCRRATPLTRHGEAYHDGKRVGVRVAGSSPAPRLTCAPHRGGTTPNNQGGCP